MSVHLAEPRAQFSCTMASFTVAGQIHATFLDYDLHGFLVVSSASYNVTGSIKEFLIFMLQSIVNVLAAKHDGFESRCVSLCVWTAHDIRQEWPRI